MDYDTTRVQNKQINEYHSQRKIDPEMEKSKMKKPELLFGDFQERGKEIADNSIDCIITDPPYDKDRLYLWKRLALLASRVLKPSGFLVTYSGWFFLPTVTKHLTEYLEWYALFTLYHKGDARLHRNTNIIDRCKVVLILQKYPFKSIHNRTENFIINEKKEKDLHEWQQGLDGVKKFVKIFTKPNDLVLDPMVGSGTTIIACQELGRRVIGIDNDKKAFETTEARIMKSMKAPEGIKTALELNNQQPEWKKYTDEEIDWRIC